MKISTIGTEVLSCDVSFLAELFSWLRESFWLPSDAVLSAELLAELLLSELEESESLSSELLVSDDEEEESLSSSEDESVLSESSLSRSCFTIGS